MAENCIDRHLATKGDQAALIWEKDEPNQAQTITYKELHRNVCRLANAYKAHGVRKGDVVTLYMPMVPEVTLVPSQPAIDRFLHEPVGSLRDAGMRSDRSSALGGVCRFQRRSFGATYER